MNDGHAKLIFDEDLIKRYDRPGPRYTSYPTAPMFNDSITGDDLLSWISRPPNGDVRKDLSLYFHIPFCDTLCYFCGCNMMVSKDEGKKKGYIDYLKREIDIIVSQISPGRDVLQIHWGGGTPSNLSPVMIEDVSSYTHEKFTVNPDAEISVEIDPRELTLDHMKAFRNGGFNRISMGVQDFDPVVQEAVNRVQPESVTLQAIDWSQELGFDSINVDLMYGLPHQTVSSFEKTVDSVIEISPDRIAVFSYAHVPWMKKHQKLIKEEWLPSPEMKMALLQMVIDRLLSAGYVYIGMDHFAKPDDELCVAQRNGSLYRNFQGYTTRKGCDLMAMGISSISQVGDIYAQNTKELDEYYKSVDQGILPTVKGYRLTGEDKLRREVITQLMCHFHLSKTEIGKEYGIDFDDHFAGSLEALKPMEEDGLLEHRDDEITVLPRGRLLIRNIAMVFDEFLPVKTEGKFSRTI